MRSDRVFHQVLINTAVANVTTSYLWFGLTFWVYLETRSVLATGIIGGGYMLLVSFASMAFGNLVDRHRKHRVMVVSAIASIVAFALAGVLYLLVPESALLDISGPGFWVFIIIVLLGAIIENLRSIALSTTVTLLIPAERRDRANGLVGAAQGLAFVVTSVFSGISVGQLGMGGTLLIAVVLMVMTLAHLLWIRIPEERPELQHSDKAGIDIASSVRAVRAVPGLFALIIFATFNNLIGGVYMALMDPYGLELFSVELWGIVLGVGSLGFLIGGAIVAKAGLGANPIRTMLLMVLIMGVLGALFTIRELGWLFAAGIFAYFCVIPVVEAAEQTVIQRVVPFRTQGRVFGFAQALEWASGPLTAFLIAPIAEFAIIPWLRSEEGSAQWSWLLGEGEMRGVALVFLVAGGIMIVTALLAMRTPIYRRLSSEYQRRASDADGVAAQAAGSDPAGGSTAPGTLAP